jgi:hypothetical protein
MLKHFLSFTGLLFSIQVMAQTGIGTTTPHASAKLEVASDNKGFLPPRVTLSNVNDATTIPTPATGLLVYNLGSVGLQAGYYYWNGSNWATIATAGGSGSMAAEFGSQYQTANVSVLSLTPVEVLSFTLPSAGTWEVLSFVRSQGAPSFIGGYAIYDAAGTMVTNSEILSAYGPNAATATGVIRITTTGSATYRLRAWASFGSYSVMTNSDGRTGVTWQKISGNTPMTVINFGDVKTGLQASDHNGWIRLNGRAKSTLSATQQTQATALGIGANLPDASNAFLVQNGGTLGNVTGSNNITLARDQLPNVNFEGEIINVAHGAFVNATASGLISRVSGNSSGNASGGGVTNNFILRIPLNGGVTQQSINITPRSLSVNTFIYLGN